MESIETTLEYMSQVIDLTGVAILIFGFIKMLFKYLRSELLQNLLNTPIYLLQKIRCEVGVYILLALDFLIVSDIIGTVKDVSQNELIELGIMMVLRTGIGYFLGKEVNEIREEKLITQTKK